jgi:hypothetical protein
VSAPSPPLYPTGRGLVTTPLLRRSRRDRVINYPRALVRLSGIHLKSGKGTPEFQRAGLSNGQHVFALAERSRSHRRSSRPDLGERWPSRLVATAAAEDRPNFLAVLADDRTKPSDLVAAGNLCK